MCLNVPAACSGCTQVLKALTRKFSLAADVDLSAVAAACPPTLSGADLYALCADAWMVALKQRIAAIEASGSHQEQQVVSTINTVRGVL